MFLQSASQELRNPPSITWRTLFQEALVVGAIAMVMALVV